MLKISCIILIFFSISVIALKSQNIKQFYKVPQYYNTAFAGINKCSNIISLNKIHPVYKDVLFFSNSLIFDAYFRKIFGAVYLSATNESTPNNIYNTKEFKFAYTYHVQISGKYMISLSVGTKYFNEYFNENNIILPSMLNLWTNSVSSLNDNIPSYKYKYLGFNTGIVFWTQKFYLSTSVNNFWTIELAEENNKFTSLEIFFEKRRFIENKKIFFSLNSAFFAINKSYSIYNGLNFKYYNVNFGTFLKNVFNRNYISNGLLFSLGYDFNKIKITYSFDFFFSGLYRKRASSSEISLKFYFNCTEKDINNTIKCPTY